jgi:hypothetical protein
MVRDKEMSVNKFMQGWDILLELDNIQKLWDSRGT